VSIAFHEVWIDQCDAAENLTDQFGIEQAANYLIGEKFINFLEAADGNPLFAAELPKFVARVRDIFDRHDIVAALQSAVGDPGSADGFVFDEISYDAHEAVMEAQRVVMVERARELLLE